MTSSSSYCLFKDFFCVIPALNMVSPQMTSPLSTQHRFHSTIHLTIMFSSVLWIYLCCLMAIIPLFINFSSISRENINIWGITIKKSEKPTPNNKRGKSICASICLLAPTVNWYRKKKKLIYQYTLLLLTPTTCPILRKAISTNVTCDKFLDLLFMFQKNATTDPNNVSNNSISQ